MKQKMNKFICNNSIIVINKTFEKKKSREKCRILSFYKDFPAKIQKKNRQQQYTLFFFS